MNPDLSTWEMVAIAGLAALVLVLFLPGVRDAMQRSSEQTEKDWRGALLPLLAVIAFVALLIALV